MSHSPVLAAIVADPDGGAVSGQFFARRQGATTWNLVNGTNVAATSGQVARLRLPALPAGAVVEWQVKSCDTTACSAATAMQTGLVSPMLGAGPRKNATQLPFQVGDRASAQVDVGSGNLLVTAEGLTVPGVHADIPLQMVYNSLSLGAGVPQAATSNVTGYGWTLNVAARLETSPDGSVIFWGPSGQSGTFAPVTGGYTPPAGVTADLVKTATGWTMTDHASQHRITFNAAGLPTSIADRNANTHTVAYDAAIPTRPVSISATRGPAHVSLAYTSNRLTKLQQGPVRATSFSYNAAGDLVTVTDPLSRVTTFTYTAAHQLTKIVAPGGIETHFTLDARNRVTAVRQVNSTAGSPGDTWTRLAYPSDTQVLVSDGAQEQAGSPTSGPRTTYTLTADHTGRVATAVDAQGRSRGATYTANFDPATTTTGSGTTAGTTTAAYGANSGESLTSLSSPTGSRRGFGYTNTAASTKYLPSSTTDDAGGQSLYTYNGAGNPLTSTDAMAAQAAVTRNTDGSVATATAPGNGTNSTKYTYTSGNLTKVTPPTGTTLGVRDMTYDNYGRVLTATNGRGITTTYTYDLLDRVTGVDHSGTTPSPDVSFTYDTAGRVATRTDPAGTTTTTYDQVSNLRSRVNTFDNQTAAYTYDKAGRMVSNTDSGGTTNYTYDTAGALASMSYPAPAGWAEDGDRGLTVFKVDDHGRRTDTWMRADAAVTRWAAHSHTDYDKSGRPTRITGERKHAGSPPGAPATTIVDISYCYAAGSTYPTCSTATTADRSFVQWRRDNVTGQLTTYTYDKARRLTGAATTAGTNPDGTTIPAVTYTYAYDARGNRTSATATGTTAQSRTHNPGNQITTAGFAHDGAGNLTTDPEAGVIAYTNGDQMASVTRAGTTYTYRYAGIGSNELLTHTTPNGTYAYTYGRQNSVGIPVIEQVKVNTSTAYLDNDPTGQPIQLRTSAGQDLLYIYDAQGSPLALLSNFDTTAFQYSFDPYGVAKLKETSGGNATGQTPFLYTGGLHDRTTGWIKNGTRYYDPTEGRWTQYDTLDAPLDPLNANRYAYAANNPVNYTDPRGLATVGGAVSTVIGTAVGAIGTALVCGASAGIGCAVAAGVVAGAVGGGIGGGVGARIDGTNTRQGAIDGAAYGAIGGAVGGSLVKFGGWLHR